VYHLGRGGIRISGGDRRTLTPGGMVVENCLVHDVSRINHTYTPAIGVDGVGNHVAHNLLHDIASSAIHVSGNDHVIEYNELARVVLESDDQGGAELFGDPTFRGNVFRWNFIHHVGSRWSFWHASSGKHGFGGVQIHGGKDNVIESNLFADCDSAISFSAWRSAQRWGEWIAKYTNRVDMALYTSRYPAMARLFEDLDINYVRGNLVAHCGKFLHRGNAATNDNAIVTNAAPLAKLLARPDAPKIPFDRIGLRRDEFRRRLPGREIRTLREGRPALP
jgi:hypothetical protein